VLFQNVDSGPVVTYIRLKVEFVYLALILDGFSRKVVGWTLDRTLASPCRSRRWNKPSANDSHHQA